MATKKSEPKTKTLTLPSGTKVTVRDDYPVENLRGQRSPSRSTAKSSES